MDHDFGFDLVVHAKFLIEIISQTYDKVAALKIHEITSKNVVLEVRSASNLYHLLMHKVRYLEHYSSYAFSLVSCCQTYLLLKGINEISRLTSVYRAVRILRNERSRFGRDLTLEDLKWSDRYLEECRHRGLHLVKRKYAIELRQRIEERSAIYRMFLSEELSRRIREPNSPIKFKCLMTESHDDFKSAVIQTNYFNNLVAIKQTFHISNKKYVECEKQLKYILNMRDMLSKLTGFTSYMEHSIQSQSLSRIQIKKLMKRILYIHEATWLQIVDECRELKGKSIMKAKKPSDETFDAVDAHYFYNVTPSVEFAPLYLYFPIKTTMSKILGLLGDYFGIQFSTPKPCPDHAGIETSKIVDRETGRLLGRLVLDIFSRKYKRYRKRTLAIHKASKEFFTEFLPNLNDEIKTDSLFERFENCEKFPVTCFVFLNLNKRVYVANPVTVKSSDGGEADSGAFKLTRKVEEKFKKFANPVREPPETKHKDESVTPNDDNWFFTMQELSEIFYEFGNVLQHIFCDASSPELRTCCSNKDFLRIPCAMLEHLLLEPGILRKISTHSYTGKQLSVSQAYDLVRSYKWEEPLKILKQVQLSYLDYFAHTQKDFETMPVVQRFSTEYLTIKDISSMQCPEWCFSLSDQDAGCFYADPWAHHISKVIFDETFKARDLNPEVGREFRRNFLEPDLDVSFQERLRKFLGENPETKSSLEIKSRWFLEYTE